MFDMSEFKEEVIRQQRIPIQINFCRGPEKSLIVNVPSEGPNSHFGKVAVRANIETEERYKNEQKKEKWDFQTLKMEIEASGKKDKVFNINMPINRNVKRSGDTKLHFLLEASQRNGLLTVVEDYTDCRMTIKTKNSLSNREAVQLIRRKLDKRRKNSYDENDHNDPDFKEENEQDD